MTWVKLSKETLNTGNDIFICVAYFTPEYSRKELERDTCISNCMVEGDIVLLGDFNARPGKLPDYCDPCLPSDLSDPLTPKNHSNN